MQRFDKEEPMATNIRVIHAQDFIRANVEGHLDFDISKKLLIQIAEAAAPMPDYEIILDTRRSHSELSVTGLWYLAAELSSLGKTYYRKTAVLCPLENFDQAEFFALCAQNRGLRIRAFTSYEDAMEWLLASGP